ncbi:MAG: hypothetical protein WA211_02995 [Candidatus Acidiferrales bacterium]
MDSKIHNFARQCQAAWMWLASFFKAEWALEDYPIRVRFQKPAEPVKASRLKLIPWIADVVNWPAMSGNGSTKQEALNNIREKFERFRATKQLLPRPGTAVPIEYAASHRVGRLPELTKDFAQRVLDIEWMWVSDESSLWDFHGDATNDALVEKIRSVYGVDVSDITSGNLADIFDRILKNGPSTPN